MKNVLVAAISATVLIGGVVTIVVVHHNDMQAEMTRRAKLAHLQQQ